MVDSSGHIVSLPEEGAIGSVGSKFFAVVKEGLEMGASDSYDAICIAARKALVELKG